VRAAAKSAQDEAEVRAREFLGGEEAATLPASDSVNIGEEEVADRIRHMSKEQLQKFLSRVAVEAKRTLLMSNLETSRHGVDAPMSGRVFVFLGAASYALYMIHLPIDIAWFHALERMGITEASGLALRVGAVIGVFVACIAASAAAYLWIEEPARKFIRKLEWPKRAPASLPSGAQ
jgi:hypothetical protein